MAIILRKFNLNYIKDSSLILIIGVSGAGKSMITKDILYYHSDIPVGIAICGSSKSKNDYGYIPQIFVHSEFNKKIVKRYVKNQLNTCDESELDSRSFFILEDKFIKNKYLNYLFQNYNSLSSLCIIEQYYLDITKELKNNVDYIFILKIDFNQNKEKIYKIYLIFYI